MNRSFILNDDPPTKHSIPIIPCTSELLNKYRIKSIHKASIRPIQEISVSIKEIEGLKSALTKNQRPFLWDSADKASSVKTSTFKTISINRSKIENVSILSKSFTKNRSKSPNDKGLFWLNDKAFVKNFEVLNKQKLLLRQEKIENVNNSIQTKAFKLKKNNAKATIIDQIIKNQKNELENQNKEKLEIEKKKIWKVKDKFQFSPFSRRFIREASPEETIFVLPPKKPGKTFLVNI